MQTSAFTLVELSIVLVIIGLLTGGILAGRDLIRAAELRSVTEEYRRILTAENVFRDKYSGIPGDLRNATSFFGSAGGDGTIGGGVKQRLVLECRHVMAMEMVTYHS